MSYFSKQARTQLARDFCLDFTRKALKKPEYNGLTDPNLSYFFSSPSRQRLLIKQRLISPAGEINERLITKRIASKDYESTALRELSTTPVSQRKPIRFLPIISKKRNLSLNGHKLQLKRPITSEQFKSVILSHRAKLGLLK